MSKRKLNTLLSLSLPSSSSTIGTHNGTFHCDEVLACFLLQHTKEYYQAAITRSRDAKVLEKCEIVCDVGAVYDHEGKRYDHHQRSFGETWDGKHGIKLSSAGLIYKHYGKEIINKIVPALNAMDAELIYQKVYDDFILPLDACDNGISAYPTDIKPLYHHGTTLPSRISHLNPEWNEDQSEELINERFKEAMEVAGTEFTSCVYKLGNVWLPARQIVLDSFNDRENVHASGSVVKLSQCCPWKEHLFEIEETLGKVGTVKFVLYGDTNGSWRTVPIQADSFAFRQAIKKDWWGIRDNELSTLSGIPECVFVHANGFIGGNKTYDGALQMASASL